MNKESFSFVKLKEIFESGAPVKEGKKFVKAVTQETQDYIDQYFYITKSDHYFLWDAKMNDFDGFAPERLTKLYLNRFPTEVKHWFNHENIKIYTVVSEILKPRVYEDKINMFSGFKFPEVKKYTDYSKELQAKVEVMLGYILEVLASGDKASCDYIIKWVANVCKGIKNDSALYLKGLEGVGKSTLSDYLIQYVLGKRIAKTAKSEVLTSPFNEELCGQILVVFEELPVFSTAEWNGVSGKFKDKITGTEDTYANKNVKAYDATNVNNYIINTNVEAIKNSEGRRYFIVPVSSKRLQDHEYFGNIRKTCFNNEVAEVFFAYMKDVDTSKFQCQRDMPETKGKLNAIADHIAPEFKFLKETYILDIENGKKDINNVKVSDLHNEFKAWCEIHKKAPGSSVRFATKLAEININYKTLDGYKVYKLTYDELKSLATKLKWMHELDEYKLPPKDENELDANLEQPEGEINEKDMVIADLRSQIEYLREQLEKYKPKPAPKIEPKPEPKKPEPKKLTKVTKKLTKAEQEANSIILSFTDGI